MSTNDTTYETLIQKITSLIDTLENYVLGLTNHPISTIDILTLVAAILAVIASGISIYITYKVNKKNRQSNEKIANQIQVAEDKRAQAAIDANLTANARIEWIQNVRQATSDFITACYRFIDSKEIDQQINLENVLKKKALLVLYFGPDNNLSDEILAENLLDRQTNKGKNDNLVKYINDLFEIIKKYHPNISSIKTLIVEQSKCSECEHLKKHNGGEKYNCEKEECTPFNEEDCAKTQKYYKEKLEESRSLVQSVNGDLQKLSEIMRIYLKIEWNRAKERK